MHTNKIKTLYRDPKDLKCFKCNNLLSFILPYDYKCNYDDEELDFYNNGNIIDENLDIHISIDDEEGMFYVCRDCNCFYLCCPKCSDPENEKIQLCRFLGHYGFFEGDKTKDIQKYRTTERIFNNITKKCNEYASPIDEDEIEEHKRNLEILNEEALIKYKKDSYIKIIRNGKRYRIGTIPYYVGDKDLYFFDTTEIFATGPDGGYPHFWVCPSCNIGYQLSDK